MHINIKFRPVYKIILHFTMTNNFINILSYNVNITYFCFRLIDTLLKAENYYTIQISTGAK